MRLAASFEYTIAVDEDAVHQPVQAGREASVGARETRLGLETPAL
jgi:hypothetical protein